MALKPCRECGHSVSPRADWCPSCGVKKPGRGWLRRHPVLTALGGLFVLGVLLPPVPEEAPVETSVEPEPTAPASTAEQAPECLTVIETTLTEFLPATHAVLVRFDLNSPEAQRVPERMRSSRGWILASPTGGLWLSYRDPTVLESNGLALAMTEQAKAESEFGSAVGPNAPGLMGLTADDPRSVRALECAGG